MKTAFRPLGLGAMLLIAAWTARSAAAQPIRPPEITAIHLDAAGAHVTIDVPAGLRQVALEATRRKSPAGWAPKVVRRLDGSAQSLVIDLPADAPHELLRVRADETDPFPAAFYTGKTNIEPIALPASSPLLYRNLTDASGNVVYLPATPTVPPGPSSGVVESDIWKVKGDRLYFFNQYRGLQVIDIAQPDAPRVLGSLPFAAAGEQLYVPDDQHVVLLQGQDCRGNGYQGAAVVIVDATGGRPQEVARLEVPGRIQESRMIGNALHVASQAYENTGPDAGVWQMITVVSSFDLATPATPHARGSLRIPGSATAVTASGSFLFVGVDASFAGNGRATVLHVLDVSAPDGTASAFAKIPLAGWLRDKFKVGLHDDVLSVVVEGQQTADRWSPVTRLTTWRLAPDGADNFQPLGKLDLGAGENLFGTRFDGTRAYVVTFRLKDPLWIVDLSHPERPEILGELQIPGWSNYLQPLGDRLLTVGIDDTAGQRAAVQLFDVGNPAQPALLSKVPIGESWSSSEANWDEKALAVLPDDGLVLLPFSSSTATGGQQGVQLIDLGRDTLKARGIIAHETLAPRRTTITANRVLSLSGRELITADITDRDAPKVTSHLDLARAVDRLIVAQGHLFTVDGTTLRVCRADTPDTVLSSFPLGDQPVLGAVERDGLLYVLQGTAAGIVWLSDASGQNGTTSTNSGVVQLRILSLASLPSLKEVGLTATKHTSTYLGDFEALWPTPTTLVWASRRTSGFYGPWYWDAMPVLTLRGGGGVAFDSSATPLAVQSTAALVPIDIVWGRGIWWPGWNQPRTLIAYDITDPAHPVHGSTVQGEASAAGTSTAFRGGSLIAFSETFQESAIVGTNAVTWLETVYVPVTNQVWRTNITAIPHKEWVTNQVKSIDTYPAIRATWDAGATLPKIAGGAFHSLLIDGQGRAWTWGDSADRWNPDGSPGDATVPERVGVAGTLREISAGTYESLGLDADGVVWTWLSTETPAVPPLPGEVIPPRTRFPTPAPVPGVPTASAIAAGHLHFLALSQGKVWGWGNNAHGQLARSASDTDLAPAPFPGVTAQGIAAGAYHSLVLTPAGLVLGYGRNDEGQLGAKPTDATDPAATVRLPAPATRVAAGAHHSAALLEDGSVWTWGSNAAGQLGRTEVTADASPGPVPGLPPIRQIAAGGQFTVALDENGQLWLWGQVDPGIAAPRRAPGVLSSFGSLESVAAGRNHILTAVADGSTLAFGNRDHGQLGRGERLTASLVYLVEAVEPTEILTWSTNVVLVNEVTSTLTTRTVTNWVPEVKWWQRHELRVVDYQTGADDPVVRPAIPFPGELRGLAQGGSVLFSVRQQTEGTTNVITRDILEAAGYDGVQVFVGDSRPITRSGDEAAQVVVTPAGQVAIAVAAWSETGRNHLELLGLEGARFAPIADVPLSGQAQAATLIDDVLLVREASNVELWDLANPAAPKALPVIDHGCVSYDLQRAVGSRTEGWWVPGGDYGPLRLAP